METWCFLSTEILRFFQKYLTTESSDLDLGPKSEFPKPYLQL